MLTVVDESTRECLAIAVRRRLTSRDVQEVLSELFLHRGCPTHIRSDNGPECIARALRAWYGMPDLMRALGAEGQALRVGGETRRLFLEQTTADPDVAHVSLRAAAAPLSTILEPITPDSLTVADDSDFLTVIVHQPNVPDPIRTGLAQLY